MCLDDIKLDLGSEWSLFEKRTAHSVNHMFSLLCIFVVLFFLGGNLVLIALVPGHCFLLLR